MQSNQSSFMKKQNNYFQPKEFSNNSFHNNYYYEQNVLLFVIELIESSLYSLAIKALLDESIHMKNNIPNIFISLIKLELFGNINHSTEEEVVTTLEFLKESYEQFKYDNI